MDCFRQRSSGKVHIHHLPRDKETDIELRENPEKRLLRIIAEKLDVAEIAQPDIAFALSTATENT